MASYHDWHGSTYVLRRPKKEKEKEIQLMHASVYKCEFVVFLLFKSLLLFLYIIYYTYFL